MKKFKKLGVLFLALVLSIISPVATVLADDIGDTGDTGGGGSGTNHYYFSYKYDSSRDAIVLRVDTTNPIASFGNTTSHTFTSESDDTYIPSSNPQLRQSLDSAINNLINQGGYELTVSEVKEKLRDLGYYDGGNGIWRVSGGYLTYIDAVKIRPKKHKVKYDANGGTDAPETQTKKQGITLKLRTGKPKRTGYTFKHWKASIGGNYDPGDNYTHDQDGGYVTMKAVWKDETGPALSDFYARPNQWSAGNGTVGFSARDKGSGISYIELERYSFVTRSWTTVKTWSFSGTTSTVSRTYTEKDEGVFYYRLTITDEDGNSTVKTSDTIYLDHSNPVMYGIENTNTEWTNIAPVISVRATDYLYGTLYNGSGVGSIVIKDDSGREVASGNTSVTYTLTYQYEGIHTWTITATDNVGHTTSSSVTTKYDVTDPGVDGTEITFVWNGTMISGYCQDNIVDQHIDDEVRRSVNNPNVSSGIKSVVLYKVLNGQKTAIYSSETYKQFGSPDTHSYFDMFYDVNLTDEIVDYYLVVVSDFAGNRTEKKLITQRTLLTLFHTSIDRSSY